MAMTPFSFFSIVASLMLSRSPEAFISGANAIQLKTTSSRLTTAGRASTLQDFISRPIHWPEIVLSSNRVEVIKKEQKEGDVRQTKTPLSSSLASLFRTTKSNNTEKKEPALVSTISTSAPSFETQTLRVGDIVEEYFALNQFRVDWTCTKNEPGRLTVVSPDGVQGIATNCVMDFEFEVESDAAGVGSDAGVVTLTMEYTPESPLAVLATPALVVDNWLALNVLLPAAIDARPLDSFRKLMGILYGFAGVAHFLDLFVGGSQLFTTVIGIPSFENLDKPFGQPYALLWCASGPLAYVLSTTSTSASAANGDGDDDDDDNAPFNKADIGLVVYGIIEVVGALLCSGIDGAASDVVINSVGVEGIVLAAWIYSYQKQKQQREVEVRTERFES